MPEPKEASKASDKEKSKVAKKLIKFVGDVDRRVLEKGETWGGRLHGGLSESLVWDWDNNHCLDASDLDSEVVDLILGEPDFVDVTGLKVHPVAAVAARLRPGGVANAAPNMVSTPASGTTIGGSGSGPTSTSGIDTV